MQQSRVEDLKDRVRILIETPLYLNSDLLENDLFVHNNGAKILQMIKKQMGLYTLLKGSQANQIKCLGQQLQEKQVGCSSFEVGLYSEQQLHNLSVTDEFKKQISDIGIENILEDTDACAGQIIEGL